MFNDLTRDQRKEVLRWIGRHENPECKIAAVIYEENVEAETLFAQCECGDTLDLSNYKV